MLLFQILTLTLSNRLNTVHSLRSQLFLTEPIAVPDYIEPFDDEMATSIVCTILAYQAPVFYIEALLK
ncbi:hypothetical protein J5TS2_25220 [Brevibacillus halotolerans]|nr:hypothetical protein J5TS2_25220 [Brevibacillus halotolerans]